MNAYADASALVKGYIKERGSVEFVEFANAATNVATGLITRAEVAATFGKAVRVGAVSDMVARRLLSKFREEWLSLTKVQVLDTVVEQADVYAYEYGLRGYDAIHLACALTWQRAIQAPVVMATFDQDLWLVAQRLGLAVFPTDLARYVSRTPRKN